MLSRTTSSHCPLLCIVSIQSSVVFTEFVKLQGHKHDLVFKLVSLGKGFKDC